MKVCVLYSGEMRTIRKTMALFKQNVLLNQDVHVYAVVQAPRGDVAEWEQWIRTELGNHLQALEWFFPDDTSWVNIRESLLNDMNISDGWKHYLRTSGSMIEHYQLYKNYQNLVRKEQEGVTYDYVVRVRTDVVLTRPLDFKWLQLTHEDIANRLEKVPPGRDGIIQLITNVLYEDRIHVPLARNQVINSKDHLLDEICTTKNIPLILEYIRHGSYVLTFRENLLFIVERRLFYSIPQLGIQYGRCRMINNDYWFNSESQFKITCINSGLSVFNYCTEKEESSLYNYNPANYFDASGNLYDPNVLFFLMRH